MCFPTGWTEDIIVPIFKIGDPMMQNNYRTIMTGCYLTKLYGSILDSELIVWAERHGCSSAGQAGFWKGFMTLDYIFIIQALIEEGRAQNKRIYCCFVNFLKTFDTILCALLMERLEAFGDPIDMQYGICALHESVSGKVAVSQWVVRCCG